MEEKRKSYTIRFKSQVLKKLGQNGGNIITNQQGLQYRQKNYSTLVITEVFDSRFCQEQSDKYFLSSQHTRWKSTIPRIRGCYHGVYTR